MVADNVKTNKHRGRKKKNKRSSKSSAEMTSSCQHPPKNLKRLLERSAWITSMLKSSNKSRTTTNDLLRAEKMKSTITDTEPDGTVDCVHQGNLNDTNIIGTEKAGNPYRN